MQVCLGQNVATTGRDVVVSLKSHIAGQCMHVRSLRALGTLCHCRVCLQKLTGKRESVVYWYSIQ